MKRLFGIFELSPNEQRVVLIIMFILITIAVLAYERRTHRSPVELVETVCHRENGL